MDSAMSTPESGDFTQTPDTVQPITPEPTPSTSVTAQVVPLVYIQTQHKLPFTPITKPSNIIAPQLLANVQNRTHPNPGVILTSVKNVGKPQQLVITKPGSQSSSKITTAYLTMLKSVTKATDSSSDNLNINNSSTGTSGKYVVASKLVKSRLPVTSNYCNIRPKIAFMPLTIPGSGGNSESGGRKKMFNFTISDGQLQQQLNSENNNNVNGESDSACNLLSDSQLKCDEIIDLNSPVKSEQEYQLSIADEDSKIEPEIKQNQPKYQKHGISILKKNYINQSNKLHNNLLNTVVDTVCNKKPEKSRRKSSFSYRKDFDDASQVVEVKLEESSVATIKTEEPVEEKCDFNMAEDCELKNMLNWDDGIGTLPGSNLKFIVNEFNVLEFVTKEEYRKICEKRTQEEEEIKKSTQKLPKREVQEQEELRCRECGCYGLPSEFINPKYCSLDCQHKGQAKELKEKEVRMKRKRKKNLNVKKTENVTQLVADNGTHFNNNNKSQDQQQTISDEEEETSNENSQDKYTYPWNCTKKGFSWTKYLDHVKAKSAPVKLFKDAFPYNRNGFRSGMKLEGIDPSHPSYFCIFTVSEICGYRVRLHFDGYPDNYDFWVNADSMDIFPVGWCEKHGHTLQPPLGYTVESFSWVQYLKQTKGTAAPKHLFVNRAGSSICPNGFRVGMKLEAVDRNNTSLVCVATVKDMMDNRILIHFDSWDDIYDYWADPTSPYIHPVGWCDQYGHSLTPPNDYPNPETFSWAKYLKETKSAAAPVRAFKQRPACGFKRGMRLECVDKRVPQLIRVATVNEVRDHQLRIHFDGWPDRYSYWMDDDCEDIHPAGWCHKTGHPLETPLTPDDVYDFLECPTVGCRGVGHIRGPKYAAHSEQKDCPYAEDNIDRDRILPDRLLTPDRHVEAVVPVSREPREIKRSKIRRPPKFVRGDSTKTEPDEDESPVTKKPKRRYTKRKPKNSEECQESSDAKDNNVDLLALIEFCKIEPANAEAWPAHSRFLNAYVRNIDDPRDWLDEEVADFVETIPGCDCYSGKFRRMEIDGEAFLSLNQRDIVDILKVKVGPAVKLYNTIVLLRQRISQSNSFS